jgi:putative SOS response-associated peptidase YedK
MCGRFALTTPQSAVREHFRAAAFAEPPEGPRYNICPTQTIGVVRLEDGARVLDAMRWGFVAPWAKRLDEPPLLINARGETIAEKPAFREACRTRRCLIPASGFYEWSQAAGKGKDPWWLEPAAGGLVAFAGVWSAFRAEAGPIRTVAIVTCAASPDIAMIHHRMPVVIAPEDYGLWLGEAGRGAAPLMKPAPEGFFATRRVSRAVNAARHDAPELMAPVEAEG